MRRREKDVWGVCGLSTSERWVLVWPSLFDYVHVLAMHGQTRRSFVGLMPHDVPGDGYKTSE